MSARRSDGPSRRESDAALPDPRPIRDPNGRPASPDRGPSGWLVLATLLAFAMWSPLNFIAGNLPLAIDPLPLLAIGAAIFALYAAAFLIGSRLLPRAARPRLAAALCVAAFATYMIQPVRAGLYWSGIPGSILACWAALSAAAIALAWCLFRQPRNFLILTAVGAAGCATALGGLVAQHPAAPAAEPGPGIASTRQAAGSATGDPGARPPVVYVILDAYPRADELRRQTGHDNSDFLGALERRGFRVLKKSVSNYFFTNLSVSSTLSMRYLMDMESNEVETYREIRPIISGRNAVADRFRSLGYSVVTSGARLCSHDLHRCLVNTAGLPAEAWGFLMTTPFPVLLSHASPDLYGRLSAGRTWRLDELTDLVKTFDLRGMFLLVHELAVHDNLYNPDCTFQEKIADNDLRRENRPDRQTDEIGPLVDTVRCVNRLVLGFVDAVAQKAPDAIVVLAADHGTGFSRAAGERSATLIRERSATLSAWRLPPRCGALPYDSMSNVNHFRAVFACLTGEKPEYLEDRVFSGIDFGQIRKARVPQ